jgi:polyhydroxyalkanoate synthesis regulator phasin
VGAGSRPWHHLDGSLPRSLSHMAVDAMQNYAHQVFGLTKLTRTKATEAAKSLLGQAGLNDVAAHTSERVTKLAEELLTASRANRNVLEKLVRAEVDKAATRLGFVRMQDLEELRAEVADLSSRLSASADHGGPRVRVSPASDPPRTTAPGRKSAAKKSAAKKAAAKKAVLEESASSEGSQGGAE